MRFGTDRANSHPVRAIVMAAVFAAGLWVSPREMMVFTALLGLLLVALSWIDLDSFRLPDLLTLGVALSGLAMVLLTRRESVLLHVAAGAGAYAMLVAVELSYRALRKKDGLGRGDAKLFGALGVWVGPLGLAPVLLAASVSGLLGALLLGAFRQPDQRVAFGPWLSLGGWLIWCAGSHLWPPLQSYAGR
ncbi:MAG: A24 family peptidase [Hyphomonas sp.]